MLSGLSIELYFKRFTGCQNGAHVHSPVPIWRLDPATNFSLLAVEFLLFHRPVEWAAHTHTLILAYKRPILAYNRLIIVVESANKSTDSYQTSPL